MRSSGMGRDVHSLMLSIHAGHGVIHPPSCPEEWFWKTEPCKFLSLDSCQKRFLWTHKEVDLAPHQVVGLVLQVEDAEKFP